MFVDVATGAKYNSALTAYFVTGDFTAPAITNYNPAQCALSAARKHLQKKRRYFSMIFINVIANFLSTS